MIDYYNINYTFFELDNVVGTPHIAGQTQEAQEAIGNVIAQQILEILKNPE